MDDTTHPPKTQGGDEDDALVRSAMLTLRPDHREVRLDEPDHIRGQGQVLKRRRAFALATGVAAAVAIVATLGFRGLAHEDAAPPPLPAGPTPTLAPSLSTKDPTMTSTPTATSVPTPSDTASSAPADQPDRPWRSIEPPQDLGPETFSARRAAGSTDTLEFRHLYSPDQSEFTPYVVSLEGPDPQWFGGDGAGAHLVYGVTRSEPTRVKLNLTISDGVNPSRYPTFFSTRKIGDGLFAVVASVLNMPDNGSVEITTATWADAAGTHTQPID